MWVLRPENGKRAVRLRLGDTSVLDLSRGVGEGEAAAAPLLVAAGPESGRGPAPRRRTCTVSLEELEERVGLSEYRGLSLKLCNCL